MTDQNLPVVDLERISKIYDELQSMEVTLDPNPIEYGPRRFNARIAQVRSMLNRVEQIFLQVHEDLHLFKRLINSKRAMYDLDKRQMAVQDKECRMGRSQAERDALADVKLRDRLVEITKLEENVFDLETVMVVIKTRRTDLKDAQSRMRDQLRLIEHDLGMNARWGSKSPENDQTGSVDTSSNLFDEVQDFIEQNLGVPSESTLMKSSSTQEIYPMEFDPLEEDETAEGDPKKKSRVSNLESTSTSSEIEAFLMFDESQETPPSTQKDDGVDALLSSFLDD